jgi:copper resistance protein B
VRQFHLLLLACTAAPAFAQHVGHHMPPAEAVDPHSDHDRSQSAAAPVDPHAGHAMPATSASAPHDPHAHHEAAGTKADNAAPVLPPPPAAGTGPAHAADCVYDAQAMRQARAGMREEHGGMETSKLLFDRLEVGVGDGRETYHWDAHFLYGGDIDKLWLKSDGDGTFGHGLEDAELQALWSRAVDPWFDLQLGVRQDFGPAPDRTHLVVGLQGLAPYWFEVDGAAFVSDRGEVTARVEAEYDLRITQRLILQPSIEADFALQDVPELDIGSGLSTAELGARLRYEFFPGSGPAVIAPVLGVEYERAFGDTARFQRADGKNVGGWKLVLGLRTWF